MAIACRRPFLSRNDSVTRMLQTPWNLFTSIRHHPTAEISSKSNCLSTQRSLFHHPRVLSTAHPSGPIIRDPAISHHAVNYVFVLPFHAASLFPPLDSCLSLFLFALHLCPPSDLVPPGSLLCTAVLDGIRARSRNEVGSARRNLEYRHREHVRRCGRHGVAAAACGLGVAPRSINLSL